MYHIDTFLYLNIMNFKNLSFTYNKNIKLKYFYEPHKNLSSKKFQKIYKDLLIINKDSGKLFTYGIFSENHHVFFNNLFLCIMYDTKEGSYPIGFFYFSILDTKNPLVHLGLTVISKNPGVDLLTVPQMLGHLIVYYYLNNFWVSTITCIPKIIGEFCDYLDDVWPSPNCNQGRPKDEHSFYLNILNKNYIQKFIVNEENKKDIHIDFKRFILKSPSKNMGFMPNYYILPKHQNFQTNLFCLSWINYQNEEDVILIGKCSEKVIENLKKILKSKTISDINKIYIQK